LGQSEIELSRQNFGKNQGETDRIVADKEETIPTKREMRKVNESDNGDDG
jgi:hypothetical protein